MRLRVLAYNVHGFKAGVGRVAQVVARFEPDLLLLNETGGRWRLRRFAREMGLQVARDPWSPFRRRVKDAVLVRAPWELGEHRLVRFADSERWLPRGAIVARTACQGLEIVAISTHLGLRPAERIRHARELVGLIDGGGPVVIAGGDLNERPDARAFGLIAERLWDVWLLGGDAGGETFPASEPTARIDAVFVSEGIRVERALVPSDDAARAASDHLPIVAELTLAAPG